MNKISDAFNDGKAFIGFVTAGDPDLNTSKEILLSMSKGGCDLIEVGIPFSDPIAEGPVIQDANIRALKNNVTTDDVFALTKSVSQEVDTPMVFMTYLNVLFKYGYDKFLQKAKDSGICGVIIPDLPYEEKDELQSVAKKYGIEVVSLVAPTSEDRIKMIAADAEGFIYTVSSMGVTGVRSEIKTDLESITKAIKEVTDVPVAIGFGINTPEQAKKYSHIADGVIVGSAIVKLVAEHKTDAPKYVYEYVKSMKDAIR
ncbi:MAG: tryptophan synthase subunit alpha [Oscillospiraceae bacterium]|nr:tryptophan synthase subunit alpha [Oscillospiraceae bacterium]